MKKHAYEAVANWVLFVSLHYSTPLPGWELWATMFWWGSLIFGVLWTALFIVTAIAAVIDPSGYGRVFGGEK